MDNKNKELTGKDSEVNVLRSIVNEKEAQFDELGKMVEASQVQLALLKEENEKNVSLLMSKESSINEFKLDLEKQLLRKEQVIYLKNLLSSLTPNNLQGVKNINKATKYNYLCLK